VAINAPAYRQKFEQVNLAGQLRTAEGNHRRHKERKYKERVTRLTVDMFRLHGQMGNCGDAPAEFVPAVIIDVYEDGG
jgi:hypothetical protein